MDSCPPEWNTEVGAEFPLYVQRRQLGLDNELVELLWQNGEIVLNSQNNRKQGYGHSRSKLIQSTVRDQNNLIEDIDTASWIDCPIDESFEKEFCSNFLSEIPPFDPVESNKKVEKVGPSEVNHVAGRQDFAPPPPLPPPPRFQTDATHHHQIPRGGVPEGSIRTVGSSHCASNQVVNEVDMSWASSCGIGSRTFSLGGDETYGQKVNERESLDQAMPSCSGGSAGSSFWKTNSQSNDSSRPKRKNRDVEESECPSDAMDSAPGSKPSQKPGMARRSRVAEVHNQSERRRRDRINEKMKALQELIPNSNKSDKASMLDEAIEYMKSLQLQIQLMWMGRGMAPMMLPGMQHYMSRIGMGIGPPMLPAIQNLMRLTRLPGVDQAITMAPTTSLAPVGHNPLLGQVNYQNQMQNATFPEQYANLMGFHSIPNNSQQPTNMPNYGFHLTQQNAVRAPRGNGSIG